MSFISPSSSIHPDPGHTEDPSASTPALGFLESKDGERLGDQDDPRAPSPEVRPGGLPVHNPDDPHSVASSFSSASSVLSGGSIDRTVLDTPESGRILLGSPEPQPAPTPPVRDEEKKPTIPEPEADPASLPGTVMTAPGLVNSIMLAISKDLDMNARGIRKSGFWEKGLLTPSGVEETGSWAKTKKWFANRLPWADKKYSNARYRYSPGSMFNEGIKIDKVDTTYLDNGNGLTGDEKREPIYKTMIHTTFSLKKLNELGDNYVHDKDIKVFIEVDSQKGTLSFKSAEYGQDERVSQMLLIHMAHFAQHAIDKTKNSAIRVDLKLPKVGPGLTGDAKNAAEASRAKMINVMKQAIEGMDQQGSDSSPSSMLKADFLKLLCKADKIALGYEKDPNALNSASVDIMNPNPPGTQGSGANTPGSTATAIHEAKLQPAQDPSLGPSIED